MYFAAASFRCYPHKYLSIFRSLQRKDEQKNTKNLNQPTIQYHVFRFAKREMLFLAEQHYLFACGSQNSWTQQGRKIVTSLYRFFI
jgi:hypothetical protein